jgi:short subunit dehydrogenase-like uncharacterized protein
MDKRYNRKVRRSAYSFAPSYTYAFCVRYHYIATKTGAIIVPSCGFDSIPSDLSAFLGNKTLKSHGMHIQLHVLAYLLTTSITHIVGQYDVGYSTTAYKVRTGISGGTLSTVVTMLEDVPRDKRRESRVDYALSPGVFTVISLLPLT